MTETDIGGESIHCKIELERKARKAEKERLKAEKIAKALARKETIDQKQEEDNKSQQKRLPRLNEEYLELTKPGEKKILQSLDLPALKNYNPIAVESAWYEWWKQSGFFAPEMGADGKTKSEGKFVIPSPPPNVTGVLHIGHALVVAIQDAIVRWQRMKGKTVLFLVGFDHAGISTQSVIEKRLWVEQRKTRHDFSREDFVDLVWSWKKEYHDRIKNQLYRLGGSYDWDREAFTLDDKLSKAVKKTFTILHEKGEIYRENRLIHWCTALQTTLSNIEVDYIEIEKKTYIKVPGYENSVPVGLLTFFAYAIEDSDEKIVVATTRPETMLGDTAIAVHPDDEEYKHLHGKFARHPFVERRIPIIVDAEIVSKEIGTRAVKITPSHDFNDAIAGKRHNLDFINILNEDGTMNEKCGKFENMKRFDARRIVVEKLKELGLFVEEKSHKMTIPVCSKTGDIIEPMMKPQWWLRQQKYGKMAIKAVKNGDLQISPDISRREFLQWMENCQDWCISRQLWWGHRIPAYFVNISDQEQDKADDKWWVSGVSFEEAQKKAEEKFPFYDFILEQDDDVLDTWFSSALWPFSTLGWPEKSKDLGNFFPADLMETGWDILFFWVAKMVTMSLAMTGKIPFKEVFCHALLRDAHGRKMSKSLGNVIDPLDVLQGISLEDLHKKLLRGNLDSKEIQRATAGQKQSYPQGIPQCGSDALRFTLCAYTTGGRSISLDVLRVDGYRRFCNKIYNAVKFAMIRLGSDFKPSIEARIMGKESLVEFWILHKLNKAVTNVNEQLEARKFNLATTSIYNFWLYEFCDVFIEASKYLMLESSEEQKISAQQTLYTCLETALRLSHPFMPFLTEELWQRLPRRPEDKNETIMKSKYPESNPKFEFGEAETKFDSIYKIVQASRSLGNTTGIKEAYNIYVRAPEDVLNIIDKERKCFLSLIKKCENLLIASPDETAKLAEEKVSDKCSVFIKQI